MAFQKEKETIFIYGKEVVFNDTYHRIAVIEGNKELITFRIDIYTNDLLHVIDSKTYQFVPDDSDNAYRWDKQAYEYAKTLDVYADAIDV